MDQSTKGKGKVTDTREALGFANKVPVTDEWRKWGILSTLSVEMKEGDLSIRILVNVGGWRMLLLFL